MAARAARVVGGTLFERVIVSSVKQFKTSEYPTVDRLADGRLFCVFSAIDEKVTGGKAVVVGTFSQDHGRTWSSPTVLIDSRPELDYDPNIIVIGSRVIVTSTTVPPTHGQFISTSRTVAVRSEDHGKTWSKPYEIPMGHRYTAGKINRGIVLRDGTAVLGYSWDVRLDEHEKLTSEGEEDCVACVMASKDRGTTWNTIAACRRPTGSLRIENTPSTAWTNRPSWNWATGPLYMLCRTGLTNLYESRSRERRRHMVAGRALSVDQSQRSGLAVPVWRCETGRAGDLVQLADEPLAAVRGRLVRQLPDVDRAAAARHARGIRDVVSRVHRGGRRDADRRVAGERSGRTLKSAPHGSIRTGCSMATRRGPADEDLRASRRLHDGSAWKHARVRVGPRGPV